MTDLQVKYYEINKSWPNKAGKLSQLLAFQRRKVERLSHSRQPDEVKELLKAVAEGHDVATQLIGYVHGLLKEVALDSETLMKGAQTRNMIQEQSDMISFFFDRQQAEFDREKEKAMERIKNKI